MKHALVVGGSMAGLLAAQVLAGYAERVTIVERDRFPDSPAFRAGVPQGRHVHIFLARGQQVLEQLFPGVGAEMRARGAITIDLIDDLQYYGAEGPVARFPSDLRLYLSTRALLEGVVRELVLKNPAIEVREACDVIALEADGSDGIKGVRVRPRTGTLSAPEEAITADLVVDASGRTSQSPEWLEAFGYGRPAQTVVNAFLGYATRIYRAPDKQRDWKAILIPEQAPRLLSGGVIWPVEDNQWIVTLTGSGGNYPPTDEEGFLAFARGISHPSIYEAIADAEPLSPIYGYRRTENQMRHYERMARLPQGFIALGDAVCAFNPVYGQGMTVAAMGAMVLQTSLEQHRGDPRGIGPGFQRALAKSNQTAWAMATASDYLVPNVVGDRPPLTMRFTHRYLDNMLHLLSANVDMYVAFIEVAHMIKPPAALFRPSIAARVLWRMARVPRAKDHPATTSVPAIQQTADDEAVSPNLERSGLHADP